MQKSNQLWDPKDEKQFIDQIAQQYDNQGHPFYSSSRLWDDGVIDPIQTRDILGMGLAVALNAPIPETKFGVFRI